jgi:hypothetical protein
MWLIHIRGAPAASTCLAESPIMVKKWFVLEGGTYYKILNEPSPNSTENMKAK